MSERPLVSIVVPAYQAEGFVAQAVRSVLDQTYRQVEVVVVDDGSTDGTARILAELVAADPRVRVVRQPNAGLPAARNAGLAHARGALIGFLDADDWLLPHKLELQVAALAAAPDVDLVYSDHVRVRDADGAEFPAPRGEPPLPFGELFVLRNWFAPMTPLLRCALADRVGPFDPAFRAAEDWDYWYRCSQAGTLRYVPGVVAKYRLHGGQMHRDRARMAVAHRRFADKHFADDPPRHRRCLASLHAQQAKRARADHAWAAAAGHLVALLATAGGPAAARRIWRLV